MEIQPKKVLIAEDDHDILEIVRYNLALNGYEVHIARTGNEALDVARRVKPDLIILDIMMPDRTGLEVCRILRTDASFNDTFILFLTALSDETTHIKGLETGGDDYITKPISPKILISRVNAFIRRSQKDEDKILVMGPISIDPIKYLTIKDGQEILFAKKEFELLYLLASKPGKVFQRQEILNRIWGNEVIVGDRTIDVHIRKIRQKLNLDCITTIKGIGYKFNLN
ncbi:MAG: response regulator transcription factor [Bacteroidetes bacterium]|nr:response regulator transcription factor [Bacteroidota bacterium]